MFLIYLINLFVVSLDFSSSDMIYSPKNIMYHGESRLTTNDFHLALFPSYKHDGITLP